jgi:hypothetical protein
VPPPLIYAFKEDVGTLPPFQLADAFQLPVLTLNQVAEASAGSIPEPMAPAGE